MKGNSAYEPEELVVSNIAHPYQIDPNGKEIPFKFEPWKEFEGAEKIPIDEPPCKHCRWFRPRIKTTSTGEFDGVVLCTRPDDMNHDFSCFQPNPVQEGKRV